MKPLNSLLTYWQQLRTSGLSGDAAVVILAWVVLSEVPIGLGSMKAAAVGIALGIISASAGLFPEGDAPQTPE